MRKALTVLLAAAALGAAAFNPGTATAKTCSPGFKHGVIGGQQKCLKRGQFCTKAYDRQYHKYGFHCHTGRLS